MFQGSGWLGGSVMEHAAFHLRSAGLNPKAITIWRSFGGTPVTSWAVLGPNDQGLMWCKSILSPPTGTRSSPRRGTWGRGWGSSSPCHLREPLGQTPVRLTGGSRCCVPWGQESSRHPKNQGVLLMAGGARPELPGGGGGAAGLASTDVPIPRWLPGSGAREPPAPSVQASTWHEELITKENPLPWKRQCLPRGGACLGAGALPPQRGDAAPAPGGRAGRADAGAPGQPGSGRHPLAWRCLR